jgi:long-chain acyl-CoA synthetase
MRHRRLTFSKLIGTDQQQQLVRDMLDRWNSGRGLRVLADQIEDAPDGCIEVSTSGSTGPAPKVVRRSFDSWRNSIAANRNLFGYASNDVFAVLGGLSHSLTAYAVIEAAHCRAGLILGGGMGRKALQTSLEQATILHATPTQLRSIAPFGPFPNVRLVLIGGGELDDATATTLADAIPNATRSVYFGTSEASFVTICNDTTPRGSVGTAYPDVEIEVRDITQGYGEIWVKSPYLFDGYAQGDDPMTQVIDGWLTVGEMGYLDDDGNLYLVGRKNRMFTSADINIFPEAIENEIKTLTGVEAAAVLQKPDAARGAVPICFYSGTLSPEALAEIANPRLPVPIRQFVQMTDWPLLAAGKTDLQALAKHEALT